VYLCPARLRSPNGIPDSDYGYNAIGAAWEGNARLAKGLAPTLYSTNAAESSGFAITYAGKFESVVESMVHQPDDMIAFGDSAADVPEPFRTVSSAINPYVEKYDLWSPVADRHNRGGNVAFCDGHVEYAKHEVWNDPNAGSMMRWNRDHRPHLK
jgi:prepilin-type processing-associated H-X9-DG protein